MKEESICEQICQAAMARMDGQHSPLPSNRINAHLKQCPACRNALREMEQGMEGAEILAQDEREESLWPEIAGALAGQPVARRSRSWLFAAVLVLCAGIRAVEIWAPLAITYWLIPIALAMAVAFFLLLQENPFAINSQLFEKGETP